MFQMGSAQSARWGRQLLCRSGGAEMESAREQITVCGMIIALMRVPTSFAVAIGHGATAPRETLPTLSPDTFIHAMSAYRSLTFERNLPQAELSKTMRKAKRNGSTKT